MSWDGKSFREGSSQGTNEDLKITIRFWWNILHVTYSMLAYRIDHYLFPAAVLRVRLLQVTNFETYKKAKAAEFHWCLGKN